MQNLQKLLLNSKRVRQRKAESFACLLAAIDQFNVDKKLNVLAQQLETTFVAWYGEEAIPELEELAADKKYQARFKERMDDFMENLDAASVCGDKRLRPFWRNHLKMMLNLMFLPTQPSLWCRLKSFFTR